MILRTLPVAAACIALTLPLAAQDSVSTAPRSPDEVDVRVVSPLPVFRGLGEPRPDNSWASWVTNADYPAASWQKGEEGTVRYQLAVDAAGKPTDCTITASTTSAALEAETCRLLMARARFTPAQNPDSSPKAGVYSDEIVWKRDQPEFAEPFAFTVAFTVDERGEVRDCRIVETTGTLPADMQRSLDRRPCPGNTRGRGVPYRDAEGRPVAREVTMTVSADVGAVVPAPAAQPDD